MGNMDRKARKEELDPSIMCRHWHPWHFPHHALPDHLSMVHRTAALAIPRGGSSRLFAGRVEKDLFQCVTGSGTQVVFKEMDLEEWSGGIQATLEVDRR